MCFIINFCENHFSRIKNDKILFFYSKSLNTKINWNKIVAITKFEASVFYSNKVFRIKMNDRLIASGQVLDLNRIFDSNLDDSNSIFELEKSSRIQKLKLTNRVEFRSWNWKSTRKIVKKSSRFLCKGDLAARSVKVMIKQQ